MKHVKKLESFTLTSDKIPEIGDVVDNIEYTEGDKIAFVDFGGVKDIPVQIVDSEPITNENEKNENKDMKHVKTYENIDAFMDNGGTEDEYLESPDYFIETYINGQMGQLRKMLAKFRSDDRMEELVDYIKQEDFSSYNDEIIEWVAKN